MELKPKITLKTKGEEAYISLKQLMVSLKWSAPVDLDLMAFYKAKDGRVGGVFSENYSGGSLGNLNSFPFIQLSGDEGVGAKGGQNEEVLRITKLDDMAEVYICAVNFSDASKSKDAYFSSYDGFVTIIDDKGENIMVPLNASESGTVAIIAKIDNSGFMGAKLVNENKVVSMSTFQSTIPGADLLKISSKIVLKTKGDSIQLKTKSDGKLGEILVNLNWNQGQQQKPQGFLQKMLASASKGVDLDLGCLYELHSGQKGAIQALGNAFGSIDTPPYVLHCGDDRTGAWSEGENLRINGARISEIRRVLVYAFIYEGAPNWSQADGVITIKTPGSPDIEVRLDEHRNNLIMCSIALFDNVGSTFDVKKVVQYFQGHREMDEAFNWGLKWVAGSKD